MSGAAHKTVLFVKVRTYELLPSGECGQCIAERDELIQINGQDKSICLRKTNEFIQEMKKCSQQK